MFYCLIFLFDNNEWYCINQYIIIVQCNYVISRLVIDIILLHLMIHFLQDQRKTLRTSIMFCGELYRAVSSCSLTTLNNRSKRYTLIIYHQRVLLGTRSCVQSHATVASLPVFDLAQSAMFRAVSWRLATDAVSAESTCHTGYSFPFTLLFIVRCCIIGRFINKRVSCISTFRVKRKARSSALCTY